MGTKMGPNYANLFVGHIEEQIFNQFNDPSPELFGRYIDDCFGATSCSRRELDQFIATHCKTLYIGETGRRLGDRFREHLLDVKNNSNVSKPVPAFQSTRHSANNMTVLFSRPPKQRKRPWERG